MSELLDLNRTAINLDLSNQNLRASCCRPILKALHHQSCLLHLDLSSNFIQDEGIKYLSQTLITLRHLTTLDVSGNGITEGGVEHLSNILRKNPFPVEIKSLKLNFNSIRTISLSHISELCRSKSIASLSLTACELEDAGAMETLCSVKDLEIGYNHLSLKGFKDILRKLNPTIVERINLERCTDVTHIGESIVEFITSGCYTSLRELNLSGLKLNEIEILDILRCLERCENLSYLDLSYQRELTFLSLKYLLFNMNNRNLSINLKGCQSLYVASDVFNMCHNQSDDLSCHPCQVQLSLPHRNAEIQRNEFIEKIRDIWDNVTHSRGIVEIGNKSLRLFCTDRE
jgi:Ran GTPase-activating protein (RanGAP) involved in mRNA processing and transport